MHKIQNSKSDYYIYKVNIYMIKIMIILIVITKNENIFKFKSIYLELYLESVYFIL